MKERLGESTRSTQVKFDILTVKTFEETIQNGTKLLHINYDLQIHDETELYYENNYGERERRTMKEYGKMLVSAEASKRIEVVGLAIPQSVKIG